MALRVEHIVVMGHAQCGGVRAFAKFQNDPFHAPLSPGDFIGSWIRLMAPSAARLGPPPAVLDENYLERLNLESIKNSIANLRTFPCVRTLEERGKIKLHGAYFGVMDGRLLVYDEARDVFEPVAEQLHAATLATPRF
jgi:carbonic anhydrase